MSKNLDGMNELNLGIVGAGNISQTHLKAALEVPGARVTAVWGQNPAKAEALARRVGAKFCRSYDELLDSGVH
ncbi:MAG TPA: Gfo/Idh/MocA family oxidoreductase, partial [Acidobacteriota bacterium]|nr:Gfo/Idh/MocA family oxidoreductase [Acidobacteriota bacterium]